MSKDGMDIYVREQALVSVLAIVCKLPQSVEVELVDLLSHRLRSQTWIGRGRSHARMRSAAHCDQDGQKVGDDKAGRSSRTQVRQELEGSSGTAAASHQGEARIGASSGDLLRHAYSSRYPQFDHLYLRRG
jgi:hypothetical protein